MTPVDHSTEHPELDPSSCYGCNLTVPKLVCTPSPVPLEPFDFSVASYQAGRRLVEEGEAKISQIQEAIDRLADFRDEMALSVARHRSRLVPIPICLPYDVLLLIVKPTPSNSDSRVEEDPTKPLWTASAVCRQWRDAVISTPALWSSLEFPSGSVYLRNIVPLPLQCYRTGLQLIRSKPCSTLKISVNMSSLRLYSRTEFTPALQKQMEHTVRSLLAESDRCHTLRLSGYVPDKWRVIPDQAPVFAHLHTITIRHVSWTLKGRLLDNIPAFERLDTDFSLLGKLVWTRKPRHLTLAGGYTSPRETLVAIGRMADTLVSLAVRAPYRTRRVGIPIYEVHPFSIRLPSLSTLHLNASDENIPPLEVINGVVHHIVQHLAAPALRTLRLQGAVEGDLLAIQKFVRVSDSRIQTLHLQGVWIGPSLISLLSDLRSLTELTVQLARRFDERDIDATDSLISALRWPHPSTPTIHPQDSSQHHTTTSTIENMDKGICPELRKFYLRIEDSMRGSTSNLLEGMIRSRARSSALEQSRGASPCFLTHVGLKYPSLASFEVDIGWLDDMKQEGLLDDY